MKYLINAIISAILIFKLDGSETTKEPLPDALIAKNPLETTRIIPYFQLAGIIPGVGISIRTPIYHNFCYEADFNGYYASVDTSNGGEASLSRLYYPFSNKGFNLGIGISCVYYYKHFLNNFFENPQSFYPGIPLFIGYEGNHLFTTLEFPITITALNTKTPSGKEIIALSVLPRLKLGYSF